MPAKTLKECIVSFRIAKHEAETVDQMLKQQPILGVRSSNQFFRKIARDFLAGKIVYKNADDMRVDSDLSVA